MFSAVTSDVWSPSQCCLHASQLIKNRSSCGRNSIINTLARINASMYAKEYYRNVKSVLKYS